MRLPILGRTIDRIIIHWSASKGGTADLFRQWHTAKPPAGKGWRDIGYHFVIRNGRLYSNGYSYDLMEDGVVERGRPLWQTGAHCPGQNQRSIGICLVGTIGSQPYPTPAQEASLIKLLVELCMSQHIHSDQIFQHSDFDPRRKPYCASLNMAKVRGMVHQELVNRGVK